ncbi:MAG: hypothetical protein KAR47_00450 [Planctomycetes bacterium]|nr:hypothetical protein [Planctomycetota bacterium]
MDLTKILENPQPTQPPPATGGDSETGRNDRTAAGPEFRHRRPAAQPKPQHKPGWLATFATILLAIALATLFLALRMHWRTVERICLLAAVLPAIIWVKNALRIPAAKRTYDRFYLPRTLTYGIAIILAAFLSVWLRSDTTLLGLIPALIALVLLFTIIENAISFRDKGLFGRLRHLTIIVLLTIPLILCTWISILIYLPRLYTPPVLTSESLAFYDECVQFLEEQDRFSTATLRASATPNFSTGHTDPMRINLAEHFSEGDIARIRHLCSQLDARSLRSIKKHDDMILFCSSWRFFFPDRPGVVYSPSRANPNLISRGPIGKYKPFTQVAPNWYISRKLISRADQPDYAVPETLIDLSSWTADLKFD